MSQKGGFELFRLCGLGHFGQAFEDLPFGKIDVLKRVVKKVAEHFLGHLQSFRVTLRIIARTALVR